MRKFIILSVLFFRCYCDRSFVDFKFCVDGCADAANRRFERLRPKMKKDEKILNFILV